MDERRIPEFTHAYVQKVCAAMEERGFVPIRDHYADDANSCCLVGAFARYEGVDPSVDFDYCDRLANSHSRFITDLFDNFLSNNPEATWAEIAEWYVSEF